KAHKAIWIWICFVVFVSFVSFVVPEVRPGGFSRCSALSEVADPLTDLNVHGGRGKRPLVALQAEHHLVNAGTKYVLDREPALDLGLAGLVRGAIDGRFRVGAVTPVPFDRRAVEVLVIVGAALEFGCEYHARRR